MPELAEQQDTPCWYCDGTGYQDVYPDQYSVTLTRRACVACDGSGRLADAA